MNLASSLIHLTMIQQISSLGKLIVRFQLTVKLGQPHIEMISPMSEALDNDTHSRTKEKSFLLK